MIIKSALNQKYCNKALYYAIQTKGIIFGFSAHNNDVQ